MCRHPPAGIAPAAIRWSPDQMITPMKRKSESPQTERAAIAAFLNAQYAARHSSDVGPLLGQLSLLLDEPRADAIVRRQWPAAVSAALCGQASPRLH
jgi:hypothetical protein